MIKLLPEIQEKYRIYFVFSFALLFCLLLMRFIIIFVDVFSLPIPFRTMIGLNVAFIFIIPIIFTFISADKMGIMTCFLLPFVIFGLIFPISDALFLNPFALLGNPQYYFTFLIGGTGLGLVGLSGRIFSRDLKKSILIYTLGISIIMINSMNIIPITYYILTGDMTSLMQIPNFF